MSGACFFPFHSSNKLGQLDLHHVAMELSSTSSSPASSSARAEAATLGPPTAHRPHAPAELRQDPTMSSAASFFPSPSHRRHGHGRPRPDLAQPPLWHQNPNHRPPAVPIVYPTCLPKPLISPPEIGKKRGREKPVGLTASPWLQGRANLISSAVAREENDAWNQSRFQAPVE
jgi:hypothetical protein